MYIGCFLLIGENGLAFLFYYCRSYLVVIHIALSQEITSTFDACVYFFFAFYISFTSLSLSLSHSFYLFGSLSPCPPYILIYSHYIVTQWPFIFTCKSREGGWQVVFSVCCVLCVRVYARERVYKKHHVKILEQMIINSLFVQHSPVVTQCTGAILLWMKFFKAH